MPTRVKQYTLVNECYCLTMADVKSLDFIVVRFLMKLFKSANMDIINDCLLTLNFHYPVNYWFKKERRALWANLLVVTICFGNSELTLLSSDCLSAYLLHHAATVCMANRRFCGAILLRRLVSSYIMASADVFWRGLRHTSTVERTLSAAEHSIVSPNSGPVWSSSRVGPRTDPVSAVHSWPCSAHPGLRPPPTPLCCRYSDIWYMPSVGGSRSSKDVCVCGRRRIVDAQQSTPTQHREDWGAVVCDEPSATSNPTGSHTRWQRFRPDCRLSTRPGHLPGFRGFHEDSCFQNSVQLLQRTPSAPVYSAIHHATSRSSCHWCMLSRLDYGNAILAGLPGRELNRLQSVLNAAARLIFAASILSTTDWVKCFFPQLQETLHRKKLSASHNFLDIVRVTRTLGRADTIAWQSLTNSKPAIQHHSTL